MSLRQSAVLALLAASLLSFAPAPVQAADPSAATALQPREGWYKQLVDFDFMRANVDIPPKPGVLIVDSRPAARQYDPGHIPGAINIPDTQFDKQVARLPADKNSLLVFYCGGVDCPLSHNSAFKAEQLGYTNIKVYPQGMPDWAARGGQVAVSAAFIKKLIDEKGAYALIDARPKRVAEKGMIPTAINISDTEFDKQTDKLPTDKATPLIYYCGGLECVLSDKSAAKAKALGYSNVLTYPEGYPEWEKLHGAAPAVVASAGSAPAPAVASPSLIAGKEKGSVTVASFEQVWKTAPANLVLVDVRDAKEYAAGTIKGAQNLPINDLEKQVGTLPTNKPVVFFCSTGARAGEAYDTIKLLRGEVQAYFLDAGIKFSGDGAYTMTQK